MARGAIAPLATAGQKYQEGGSDIDADYRAFLVSAHQASTHSI